MSHSPVPEAHPLEPEVDSAVDLGALTSLDGSAGDGADGRAGATVPDAGDEAQTRGLDCDGAALETSSVAYGSVRMDAYIKAGGSEPKGSEEVFMDGGNTGVIRDAELDVGESGRSGVQGGQGLKYDNLGSIMSIQAAIRGRLTRKEARQAHHDAQIILPRSVLIQRLRGYPDQRTSQVYLLFYLVYVAVAIAAYSTALTPNEEYSNMGTVRVGVFSRVSPYSIHSLADYYTFFKDGIFAGIQPVTTSNVTMAHYDSVRQMPQALGHVQIALTRRKEVACSSLYVQAGAWDNYNLDRCQEVGSYDTETYGGSSDTSLDAQTLMSWYYSDTDYVTYKTTVDQYIGSSATLCPRFHFREITPSGWQLLSADGAYLLQFPTVNSTRTYYSNHAEVFTMLQRCDFIDPRTSSIYALLVSQAGQARPSVGILRLIFHISTDGVIAFQDHLMTIILLKGTARQVAAEAMFGCLIAVAILALAMTFIDFLFNMVVNLQWRYIFMYLRDLQNVLGIVNYTTAILSAASYFSYQEEAFKQIDIEASGIGSPEYVRDLHAMQDAVDLYRLCAATNIFVTCIRFIGYTRHRTMLSLLWKVGIAVAVPTLHFLFSFFIVLFSFCSFAHAYWGPMLEEYSSLDNSIHTLLQTLAGSFDYNLTKNVSPVVGPMFFVGYFILASAICMNFLVAIVLEGYAAVATQHDVDVTLWVEFWNVVLNAHYILLDAFARKRIVSSSHLAHLIQYDTMRRKTKHDISLLRVFRLAGHRLSPDAQDAIYGVMKDTGVPEEKHSRAYANPYKYLKMDYLTTRYGPLGNRLVFNTPVIFRRYVLLALHIVQIGRAKRKRLAWRREVSPSPSKRGGNSNRGSDTYAKVVPAPIEMAKRASASSDA